MSRKKKAVAQGWGAIAQQRDEANKSPETKKEEITPEEHQERIELLKSLGILKE